MKDAERERATAGLAEAIAEERHDGRRREVTRMLGWVERMQHVLDWQVNGYSDRHTMSLGDGDATIFYAAGLLEDALHEKAEMLRSEMRALRADDGAPFFTTLEAIATN